MNHYLDKARSYLATVVALYRRMWKNPPTDAAAGSILQRVFQGLIEFNLRPAPFWSFGLKALLVTVIAIALHAWSNTDYSHLSVIATTLCSLLLLTGLRHITLPRQAPPIQLYGDRIVLPTRPGARRLISVPLADLLTLDILGHAARRALVLATRNRLFVFPTTCFVDSDGLQRLVNVLQARIMASPEGTQHAERLHQRRQLTDQMKGRRPVATYTLLTALVVVYFLEQIFAVLDTPFGLIDMGANAPILVQQGQWFRLVSANFLHGNATHLLLNGLALFVLGSLLERFLGRERLLLLFCLSALGGATASALTTTAALSVGSSTALFGMLGGLAYLNLRFHPYLPIGVFQPRRWWFVIIGINVALPVFMPQIDVAAHLGGFAAGLLTMYCLYPRSGREALAIPPSARITRWSTAMVLVFALGLAWAGMNFIHPSPIDKNRIADSFIRIPSQHPQILNNLAWEVAARPDPSEMELEIAYRAAARAVARQPDTVEYLDTLATLEYRVGRFDAAIAAERLVLARDDSAFFATQLGRFLRAKERREGTSVYGPVTPADIQLDFDLEKTPEPTITVEFQDSFAPGLVVYAQVTHGDQLLGLLELIAGPNHPLAVEFSGLSQSDLGSVPDGNPDLHYPIGCDWLQLRARRLDLALLAN